MTFTYFSLSKEFSSKLDISKNVSVCDKTKGSFVKIKDTLLLLMRKLYALSKKEMFFINVSLSLLLFLMYTSCVNLTANGWAMQVLP